jgi:hypothetical protein
MFRARGVSPFTGGVGVQRKTIAHNSLRTVFGKASLLWNETRPWSGRDRGRRPQGMVADLLRRNVQRFFMDNRDYPSAKGAPFSSDESGAPSTRDDGESSSALRNCLCEVVRRGLAQSFARRYPMQGPPGDTRPKQATTTFNQERVERSWP